MPHRPPAEIGMPLAEVDTPALIIDLDAFDRNLRALPQKVAAHGVKLRPHSKTHKSPIIALKQMALGAVGVCCQKVSEAEALVEGGVRDILIANEVVGAAKLRRLAALARHATLGVCIDDAGNLAELEDAAIDFDARIKVLVEIDVGAGRCGVAPGKPALALAQAVAGSKHLSFDGLQAYQGSAQHVRNHDERRQAIERAVEMARDTKAMIEAAGIACPRITGAGTGSFAFEAASAVYTELQCGSYIFMDADYNRNLDASGKAAPEFEQSLFVWTTVMSRPSAERAIVDAGLKALSVDSGMPVVTDFPDAEFVRASDEHGKLAVKRQTEGLDVGDKIRLTPGHCDPTVNLYDWYVGVRRQRVECIWPVAARGALT
ncbi:MAG: DSD1 family PLP-dependent enzyme [Betaproteobacteria bacterium]|nr:MAG: DSD1 family PLP-dependent enzyme [Betaproteobacteria bacterium]